MTDPLPPDGPAAAAIRRVRVHPGALTGTLRVPGDKSLSHRAVLFAALADDGAEVRGVLPSGDVLATIAAVQSMGGHVDLARDERGQLSGRVQGPLAEPEDVVDCGNSGTGMRLLAGVAAGLDGVTVLTGDTSLRSRPMGRIIEPLRHLGAGVDGRLGGTRPPLVVRGGALSGGTWDSPVASAQVKSCLLLAGLTAGVPVRVTSPLVSRDHTERLFLAGGVGVETHVGPGGEESVAVSGRQQLHFDDVVEVPGDPSSAAFWHVAAAIASTSVTVLGMSLNPRRTGALSVLAERGARVDLAAEGERTGEPVGDVTVAADRLGGDVVVAGRTVVDGIDELPVLALAGAVGTGSLHVRDAAELRAKESDRIAAVARTFRALGMVIEEREDGYLVPGGQQPGPGTVDAAGDHRIAMTACIAATIATGPIEVTGFESVATSYPTFLDDLALLGGQVEVLDAG